MDTTIAIVTLIAFWLIVYHHIGYPMLLKWLAKREKAHTPDYHYQRHYQAEQTDAELPSITLILPAYNEQGYIADKIRNLACLDYPSDKLTVFIGCDGCSDDTVKVALAACQESLTADLNIQVFDFKENRGKVAVLNDLIGKTSSDLVALSDISALLSIDALLLVASHFEQEDVGVVTGLYKMFTPSSQGEGDYWNYQSQVKQNEANLGATIGVHGAFYAFRRDLFTPLAADTINDDFILPMSIVKQGYRAAYETQITALELEQVAMEQDHHRRRRIAAGNIQQLWRLKELLNPKYKGIAFNFFSGKALRTIMPFILVIAFAGSLWLSASSWFFILAAGVQVAGYMLAVIALLLPKKYCPAKLATLAYIVSGYSASLWGCLRYLVGLEKGRWHRVSL
ncbi:glycosyltransferase family 2 protein [Catenovulum sp. SM1970]|uniref:glycosyltransferase family 2 protein n=1 Tax=Marinifaba aquimaris TaxID=2741323 RepID=UPI001573C163|nr:glycosyltransferase family 2 protein [Marinifaba aquimaris]NTS76161.1 glycosyltransferase family 2 protein [Marinifaba aquimaris]